MLVLMCLIFTQYVETSTPVDVSIKSKNTGIKYGNKPITSNLVSVRMSSVHHITCKNQRRLILLIESMRIDSIFNLGSVYMS